MKRLIKKIVVIGSGNMGAGIAAQIANAGYEVYMLDVVQLNSPDPNLLANNALERLKNSNPPLIASPRALSMIRVGNLRDDVDQIAQADWIIEVIVEDLEIKQDLYKRLEVMKKPEAIISSNTSTIKLFDLRRRLKAQTKANFVITHFFNPVRYMKLMELVREEDTDPEVVETIRHFCEHKLGKEVIICADRPGFIANRIGCYFLEMAMRSALQNFSGSGSASGSGSNSDSGEVFRPEIADHIVGIFGLPKTGIFGLFDLIGLDLMPMIAKSLTNSLGAEDEFSKIYTKLDFYDDMLSKGLKGRKSGSGFYKLTKKEDGTKTKEIYDWANQNYITALSDKEMPQELNNISLSDLLKLESPHGQFARDLLINLIGYSCSLINEVTDKLDDIDLAMKLGYSWKYGPFELLELIGLEEFGQLYQKLYSAEVKDKLKNWYIVEDWVNKRKAENQARQNLPYKNIILFNKEGESVTRTLIEENHSARLYDLGDKILQMEIISKASTMDPFVCDLFDRAAELGNESKYKALVIANDSKHFCTGANLGMILELVRQGYYADLEKFIRRVQKTYLQLRKGKLLVVSAVRGNALGGGCEMLLHSDAVIANLETYAGLVEVKVGLIPAWGGTKESLLRTKSIKKAFRLIAEAKVSTSCDEYKANFLFDESDRIFIKNMNDRHLLQEARNLAYEMMTNKNLAQNERKRSTEMIRISDWDDNLVRIYGNSKALQYLGELCEIVNDKFISEDEILDLEVQYFMKLTRLAVTSDLIKKTIKPK